ncbi:GGDEF domain-containing protein [Proteiniclasticum ruminis]|uniref:Diguanylate cyclase (GGDEF) domain-containing protein n=1 Tax=Proteiniclasticum ruminis TaxID=398199 RepID=A0A1G8I6F8_9CLOT|nr:GGDEF domain-containing protein [Proteiniclasticum ruminis]SDI14528.1 diguanylate cyclase (GGDEF) domain-containing protein [Proteiniclasticum ruminis]
MTKPLLYEKSELFFTHADQAVDAAESYSENIASRLLTYEIFLILMLSVILVVLCIQIFGEIKLNKKLNVIAYIDVNTGLPNSRSCEHELSKGEILGEKEAVCCFMFDLNNLKEVNDTLGHSYGDLLISSFATILRRAAPKGMFVGRIAGDEFMGILRNTTEEEINAFAEALKAEQIALKNNPTNYAISVSYAMGYAYSKEYQNSSLRKLLDVADMEMYKDKKRCKETKKA